jgi:hypothetical protein
LLLSVDELIEFIFLLHLQVSDHDCHGQVEEQEVADDDYSEEK